MPMAVIKNLHSVGTPILQLDCPTPSIIVIDSGFNFAGESNIFEQVEFIGYVLQVSQSLRLPGEMLGPVPLVEQFLGKRICVRVAFRIEPGAGVAIPVPGASRSRSSFEDAGPSCQVPAVCTAGTGPRSRPLSRLHRSRDLVFERAISLLRRQAEHLWDFEAVSAW